MAKNLIFKKTVEFMEADQQINAILAFNQFSEDIEFLRTPEWDPSIFAGKTLDDQDITQLRYYLSNIHNSEPARAVAGEACYIISKRHSYHPVKKHIEAAHWDNIQRIDEWLINSVHCEDNPYTRAVSAKFLIATVARVYNPGCKFDHMLILEGDQGIGKSTLVELLAGDWYLDTNFNNKDKDLIDSMRGALIIEISELTGMNKKDVDWLKSFLSKKVDRVRLPYAARSKDFQRKCVFVGTYNPSGNNMYLRDDTGNRRFWPVECNGMINFSYVKEYKNQLWAEALVRYKNKEKYFIYEPEVIEILNGMHRERELESPTYNTIREWLNDKTEVSMREILEDCMGMKGKSPSEQLSGAIIVGIIMKKLGWRKGINTKRDRYYLPNKTTTSKQEPIIWEE